MNVSSVVLFDALSSRINQRHMIANIAIRLFLPLSNSWTIWASLSTLQIRPSICIFKRLILLFRLSISCSVLLSSLWLISSWNSTCLSVCFSHGSNFTLGWSFFICFHFCGFMMFGIKNINSELFFSFIYIQRKWSFGEVFDHHFQIFYKALRIVIPAR